MHARRIAVAAVIGLPAAATTIALVETARFYFRDRDHTLHFGDRRFGVLGHWANDGPPRYVGGCRYCDADRTAAAHWPQDHLGLPGHVDPVDGCIHCKNKVSADLATALADFDEQAREWLRAVSYSEGFWSRAGEFVLDATVDRLCDQLERLLWRWSHLHSSPWSAGSAPKAVARPPVRRLLPHPPRT